MITRSLLAALAVSLAACGGDDDDDGGPTTPTQPTVPTTATVEAAAAANTFTPAQVTIARNGTVTWTFGARIHNVTFTPGTGAPADIADLANAQAARTFATTGTFAYTCTRHAGMNGSVVVK